MSGGILGKLFDLDRDGKLDLLERTLDFALFEQVAKEENESSDDSGEE